MNEPPNPEVAIFAAALELPADQRGAYLDQTCAGDLELRRQVEALLRVHDDAGNFFDKLSSVARPTAAEGEMPGSSGTIRLPSIPSEKLGDRIGRYKLLQQIGEGGCGVVYMAEQEEPVRRRVALKVIKLGMDTKSVIARFEAERQALALMDHPNIAKVLEAGATETGRPYFVMELVRGVKITDYCNENRLSTVARLELFIQVCQAIQHAHQKGIIHRDIKPSNILVADHDGKPVPKIIDFGIAKATTDQRLTDKTLFTAFEQFIGTPAYMSPEQARLSGLDIDTRSDIYSLGVLLYELLMGKTPFESDRLLEAGLDEIRRIIREDEPLRPSTRLQTLDAAEQTTVARHRQTDPPKLAHLIRGDLDWIVMKCLEKDRARRYETANGLAADIQRHLSNEPVNARPPSGLYRLQKSIRRNKGLFGGAIVIASVLVAGVAMSTLEAIRATRAKVQAVVEKERANREAATANRVTGFMQQMLATANPESSKSPDYTVRAMLDDFAAAIDAQFPDDPQVAAELHTTIGKAYWNMQQGDKAKAQLARALELRAAAYGTNSADYADSLVAYTEAPGTDASATELEECEVHLRRALAIYHANGIKGYPVIHALWALQMIFDIEKKYDEIEGLVVAAQAETRQSPGTNYWELPAMNNGLIGAKAAQGKYAEAETIARETIAENIRLFGPDYIQTAWAYRGLSQALLAQSKYAEALAAAKQAVAIMRKRVSPDQLWYGYSVDVVFNTLNAASSARSLTNLFSSADQLEELETLFQERLGSKPLLPDDSSDPANVASRDVPQFPELYLELANELTAAGRTNAAEECRQKAVALLKQLQTKDADNPDLLAEEAITLLQAGKLAEAEIAFRKARTITLRLIGPGFATLPALLRQEAQTMKALGKAPEAEKLFEDAINVGNLKLGQTNLIVGELLLNYGNFLWGENKLEEATEIYLKALPIRRAKQDDNLAWVLRDLGGVFVGTGRLPEAVEYLRESLTVYRKLHPQEDITSAWTSGKLGEALWQQRKLPEAEQAYRDSLSIYTKLGAVGTPECADAVDSLLNVLKDENKPAESETLCRQILAQQRAALGTNNPAMLATLVDLADALHTQGKQAAAEQVYRDVLDIVLKPDWNKHLSDGQISASSDDFAKLGHLQWHLGQMLLDKHQPGEAEQLFLRALQVFETGSQAFPREPFMRQEQAFSHRLHGDALEQLGRVSDAESDYRAAIALYAGLNATVPKNPFYSQEEGYTTWMLAEMLQRANRLDTAEIEYRHAITLHKKASTDFPNEAVLTERLGTLKVRLAELLSQLGRLPEAKSMYQEAAEHGSPADLDGIAWLFATSADPNLRDGTNAVSFGEKAVAATQRKNVSCLHTLAAAYAEAGRFTNAVLVQQEAMALMTNEADKKEFSLQLALYQSSIPYRDHGLLAEKVLALLQAGKFAEAEPVARECVALREKLIPNDWRTFNARSMLGGSLLGQKKYVEAEPLLLSGYEGMKQREVNIPPEGKVRLNEALKRLAQLYDATQRPDEAAEWEKKLAELEPDKKK